MIRTTLAALALLAASPALAQSFYPNLYGLRYCQLRDLGVSANEARKSAMAENWSRTRRPIMTTYEGKPVSTDVLESVYFISRHCPEYLQ
jgi:hypothetical protein